MYRSTWFSKEIVSSKAVGGSQVDSLSRGLEGAKGWCTKLLETSVCLPHRTLLPSRLASLSVLYHEEPSF